MAFGGSSRFVVEIIDKLDITVLKETYIGSGSNAYHPRMILTLLFYSYAIWFFPPVRLRDTHDSLAMRYIAANQHPDHGTTCTFRYKFLHPLNDLFVQILEIVHYRFNDGIGTCGYCSKTY